MGLAACQSCGYAYYRTSTRTTTRMIYYYRCLGSDDYRYEGGRVCGNKPVRADYLDEVVWGQVTALLADPALVQGELDRRLTEMRASSPATSERARLERELARTAKAIARLVQAYQEDLLTLDELRARMPDLRAKQTSLKASVDALDAQVIDRETYLKLAENLESFLARLRDTAETATVEDRQKALRSVVKEVLVGPERVVIRHSIPVRNHPFLSSGYPLRWGSRDGQVRGLPGLEDMFGPGGQVLLDKMDLPQPYRYRVDSLRRVVELFDDEVDIAENQVRKRLRGHRGYRAVQALHGVGPVMAAIFVAEVGDVCRFVPPATSAAGPGSPPCKASQTIRRAGATSPNRGPRWCAGPPSRQSYATTAGPPSPRPSSGYKSAGGR